jgi:hypothetical protein
VKRVRMNCRHNLGAMTKGVACRQRLSIAPMMQCTDKHFRFLARLVTRETHLWTEMVVDQVQPSLRSLHPLTSSDGRVGLRAMSSLTSLSPLSGLTGCANNVTAGAPLTIMWQS